MSPTSSVRDTIVVTTQRLDALPELLLAPWRRLFVKIDVQGAEGRVLDGAAELWPRIRGLQLELSMSELYLGERPWRQVLDELGARGFFPRLWLPGYFDRHLGRQLQVDVVLFRDPPSQPRATSTRLQLHDAHAAAWYSGFRAGSDQPSGLAYHRRFLRGRDRPRLRLETAVLGRPRCDLVVCLFLP